MGPPLQTSPKRIRDTYKYYATAFGESVLLAGRSAFDRLAAALSFYRDRLGFDITFQGPADNWHVIDT